MKILSAACFICALLFCSPCKGADFITLLTPPSPNEAPYLRFSESLVLAAGDSATAIYSPTDTEGNVLEVQIGEYTFDLSFPPQGFPGFHPTAIAGPATLRMKSNRMSALPIVVTFTVTRANSPANVIPANAVVIPEDAGGQYQVILESSTDLLNWAVTNPGTYGGSTPKRFFRTRIVKLN
jgi:hypothetical protein